MFFKKKDFVFDRFKSLIETNGLKIDTIDEEGLIYILKGMLTLKVSLDNVRKNYARDKDETHIIDLVKALVEYNTGLPKNWLDIKSDIYISLFPSDYDFQNFINNRVTDRISKVYVYSQKDNFAWLSEDDLIKWGITEAQLDQQASANADNLLIQSEIKFDIIDGRKLGRIEIEHESLKGALLLAPAMKEKATADFGLPFYAVIPVRDFCYIFSEEDYEFFSIRVGNVVVDEYKTSGYPISTELLKFNRDGVEVVGEYPIN